MPPPKPTPKPESPKPKFSSNNSSSADSSSDESSDSSEDSSDDDHAKAKKTSKVEKDIDVVNDLSDDEDDEDTNCIDNVFSLSSLITRVRSTHSPGGPSSNLSQHQPSPRNAEVNKSTCLVTWADKVVKYLFIFCFCQNFDLSRSCLFLLFVCLFQLVPKFLLGGGSTTFEPIILPFTRPNKNSSNLGQCYPLQSNCVFSWFAHCADVTCADWGNELACH